MKKKITPVEVGKDVFWNDETEEWSVSEDFVYDDACTYWFFCDHSNESFVIYRDEADNLVIDVGSPDEDDSEESELEELLERARAAEDEQLKRDFEVWAAMS